MSEKGYKVGMIGTEPQSLLFEMDYVYPMGYNSTVYITEYQSIILLNYMLNNLSLRENDIIIVGSQSNTVPYIPFNLNAFPCKQHYFLLGTYPDIVIVCINIYDEIDYILNTIKYIEGTVNYKVIAIVIFPLMFADDWKGLFGKKIMASDDRIKCQIIKINEKIKLPIFNLNKDEEIGALCNLIIDSF